MAPGIIESVERFGEFFYAIPGRLIVVSFMPASALALAILAFTIKRVCNRDAPPPSSNRLDYTVFVGLVSRGGTILIGLLVISLAALHVLWALADLLLWQGYAAASDPPTDARDRNLIQWLSLGPLLIVGYSGYILWTLPRSRRRARTLPV